MSEISFIDYKNLKILDPTPIEEAGQALNFNFSYIGDKLEESFNALGIRYTKSEIDAFVLERTQALQAHIDNLNNPHNVTVGQIGASPVGHHHVLAEIDDFASFIAGYVTLTDLTSRSYATTSQLSLGLSDKANILHSHTISQVTGLQTALDLKATQTDLNSVSGNLSTLTGAVNAHTANISNPHGTTYIQVGAAPLVHNHDTLYYTQAQVTSYLTGKANTIHSHAISDITNLQTILNSKLDSASQISLNIDTVNANGLSYSGGVLALALANTSSAGALTSAHYNLLQGISSTGSTNVNSTFVKRDGSGNINVSGINVSGAILPTGTTQDIGSPTQKFRAIYSEELFLSTNTLYIGDTAVLGTSQDTINIKADPNQSINMQTSGTGHTTVSSVAGVILTSTGLNSDVQLNAQGAGGRVVMGATSSINLTAPAINIAGALTVNSAVQVASLTVTGNATVLGSSFIVNATQVDITDNILKINKGEIGSGVTAGTAGIRVDRGEAPDGDYYFVFDEVDDRFKVGKTGQLETLASQPYVNSQITSLAPNLTLGTTNGLTLAAGQILSLALATASTSGAMSATDKALLDNAINTATINTLVKRDNSGAALFSNIYTKTEVDTKVSSIDLSNYIAKNSDASVNSLYSATTITTERDITIKNGYQVAWQIADNTVYFGTFQNPAGNRVGYSVPGNAFAAFDVTSGFMRLGSNSHGVSATEQLEVATGNLKVSAGNIVASGSVTAAFFVGDGSGLTGLPASNNASNLTTGTLADARLSSNVPLKNAINTFTAKQFIDAETRVGGGMVIGAIDVQSDPGQMKFIGTYPYMLFLNPWTGYSTGDGFQIGVEGPTLEANLLQKENAPINVWTGGAKRFIVNPNGNINIGGTTDDGINKLQVNGSGIYNPLNNSPSGSTYAFYINPTYTQGVATTSNTDLLINRIETSIGAGAQLLIDAQVSGTSKFNVDRTGTLNLAGSINLSGDLNAYGNRVNIGGNAASASFHSGNTGLLFKPTTGDRAIMELHSATGGSRALIQAVDGAGLFVMSLNTLPTIFENNYAGSYVVIGGNDVTRGLRFGSGGTSSDVGFGRTSANNLQVTNGGSGLGNLTAGTITATTFVGDGSQLTNIPTPNLTNYARLDQANTFAASQAISSGNVINLYNTVDQTINYEKISHYWTGNNYKIEAQAGGTGVVRPIGIGPATTFRNGASTSGTVDVTISTPLADQKVMRLNGVSSASSGTYSGLALVNTYSSQTGTAGFASLLIDDTSSGRTGSGSAYSIQCKYNGGDRFRVDASNGAIYTDTIQTNSGNAVTLTLNPRNFTASANSVTMATGAWSHSTGNGVGVYIAPSADNTTGTGALTALVVNLPTISASTGNKRIADFQYNGSSRAWVENDGSLATAGNVKTQWIQAINSAQSLYLGHRTLSTAVTGGSVAVDTTWTNTTGNSIGFAVNPTYNQTTSTAANTDLLINRTETAVGSGTQLLIDAQVGGVSKFRASSNGTVYANNYVNNGAYLFGGYNGLSVSGTKVTVATNLVADIFGSNSASSGNEYGVKVTNTVAQTGTAASTDLLIQRTQTSVGSGAQLLIDAQVGGTTKFKVSAVDGSITTTGHIVSGGNITGSNGLITGTGGINPLSVNQSIGIHPYAGNGVAKVIVGSSNPADNTATSGNSYGLQINTKYNQISGTASNTDLLITRTQTAVGSGNQLLIDAQVGGSSKFSVNNTGRATFAGNIESPSMNTYTLSSPNFTTLEIKGGPGSGSGGSVSISGCDSYDYGAGNVYLRGGADPYGGDGSVIIYKADGTTELFRGHSSGIAFFGVTPVDRQSATIDIKDALTAYGLLAGTSPSPLNLDGGTLTAGAVTTNGDVEITDATKGIILKSPNGTRARITLNDDLTLQVTSL